MLKVEDYARIRRAHWDGMSIREIARTFHHSRHKIREVLQDPQPRGYRCYRPNCDRTLYRILAVEILGLRRVA